MTCSACSARLRQIFALTFAVVNLARPLAQRRGHRTAAWSTTKLSEQPRKIIRVDLPPLSTRQHRRNNQAREKATRVAISSNSYTENISHIRPERHHGQQPWQVQKEALRRKFKEGSWSPFKRLSPDALDGIRAMHSQFPDKFTTPVLAEHFKVSPEVIRRILKSKWTPSEEEMEDRRLRWERRGQKIWAERAEKGVKPPKKWRRMDVGRLSAKNDTHETGTTRGQRISSGIKVYSGITATRVTDYGNRHSRRSSGVNGSELTRKSLGERIM